MVGPIRMKLQNFREIVIFAISWNCVKLVRVEGIMKFFVIKLIFLCI